jgi:hypothetical protein
MQLANNQFIVLSVNPEIKTKVKKWAATVNGEPTIQSESQSYQRGTATDGSHFDGEKTIFTFDAEPGTVEAEDIISGSIDHRTPTHINAVIVERGKGSLAPKRFTPKPLPKFDPDALHPNIEYAAPEGVELTFVDLTHIVRELQQRVRALESKLGESLCRR